MFKIWLNKFRKKQSCCCCCINKSEETTNVNGSFWMLDRLIGCIRFVFSDNDVYGGLCKICPFVEFWNKYSFFNKKVGGDWKLQPAYDAYHKLNTLFRHKPPHSFMRFYCLAASLENHINWIFKIIKHETQRLWPLNIKFMFIIEIL